MFYFTFIQVNVYLFFRDQKVLQTMLEAEALPCLVAMITAEHAVMQNEALLALTLISAMGLQDTISILVENKIGHNIFHLLKEFGTILTSEVVLNCLSLLEQLTVSGNQILFMIT